MAYYASLTSLNYTIEHITYLTQTSVLPEFPLIHRLYEEVNSLREYFDSSKINRSGDAFHFKFSREFNDLNEQVREEVCMLEDVLESKMSSLLRSHHPNLRCDDDDDDTINGNKPLNLSIDFEQVEKEILSFIGYTTKVKIEYSKILISHMMPERVVVDSSTNIVFTEKNSSELVGLHNELKDLKHRVMSYYVGLRFISIYGMAGIGKTALAKAVCEDSNVWHRFDYHLFVPIGPNYLLENTLLCILSQLNHGSDDDHTMQNYYNEEKLEKRVAELLNYKRYIILLDDVWSEKVLNDLKEILPDNSNRSRVLLTTRLYAIAEGTKFPQHLIEKRFMDEEESWDLLCKKIFGNERCPYELKKLGKKIAEKCEGLPLAIISIGHHLAKAEKTKEYWEYVVEKGITSIIAADDGLLKTLHPSYVHLDEYLKALFLYMGVFPQYHEITTSKLFKLWTVEGFLEVTLNEFDNNSLVLVKQRGYFSTIKTCQLHIVYWTYCKIQASKENLFRILHTCDDCFVRGIESQRRLCIHNNSLFGIKDSYNAMSSVSNARSLLCTGPYHKYPVPFGFGLKLLRILDAVTIRFYEFPSEVLKLVVLQYLALTYDGDLPPSISRVVSLWYLIVHRHHRIISPTCPSYLPKEIWKMKELRHLQVVGSDLPEPPCGELLPNLLKLLDITPQSCTKQVLESLPNLNKLGVQIVLPRNATEPICSLDYLRSLNGLLSLKCTVVNPKPSSRVAALAYPTSILPKCLEKLSLSGFGYSWDQMIEISAMRNLRMLKLRHCAFQGPTWVVGEFYSFAFLLLEDIDLQCLDAGLENLWLESAIIKHCYKLERFPWECVSRAGRIEIVDCKPCLSSTLNEHDHKVSVVSSWEDKKKS